MIDRDLSKLDACGLAELIRLKKVSPLEAVDSAIEAAEELNPKLNAIIHPRYEKARAEAKGQLADGPFRGVPIVLKDLGAPMAGEPYYGGTTFLKSIDFRPTSNSYLTQSFLDAGFNVIGRTNCPEMGTTITTEPLSYGPSRNPWSLNHSTGGSSGGSAAAVAAGIVSVAHGNDGGGSIRIPSSACGLFGFKPSRGRVSQGPEASDSWAGAAIDHVLTRSVRDSASILDLISGYRLGDPYVAPVHESSFADQVNKDPGRLRIGFVTQPLMEGYSSDLECVQSVLDAAKLCESLGHEVVSAYPKALEDPAYSFTFVTMVASWVASDVSAWSNILGRTIDPSELEADNALFCQVGMSTTAPQYLNAIAWLSDYRRRIASFWEVEGFDILITPTLPKLPPEIGYLCEPGVSQSRVLEYIQFTGQFNVAGNPAASIPFATSASGLPIGVQLVGAYGREGTLLRLCSQFEEAIQWMDRYPSVHASNG